MTEVKRKDEIQGEILHVYDGIEEADNHLPVWWLLTFYGAVVFGIAYWFVYEGYEMVKSPMAQYQDEAAAIAAASGAQLTDDQLGAFSADAERVTAGRAVFVQNCVVCHGERGEGKIGPNLTDDAWIHGGTPTAVFRLIRSGFAAKGMPQWGTVLGPRGTQNAAAYVISLRNTNAAGGKAPEGEPYVASGSLPGI